MKGSDLHFRKFTLAARGKDWKRERLGVELGPGKKQKLFQAMKRYSGGGLGEQVNVGNMEGVGLWYG